MKIENKLTLRHLKINKRRSIITILGIIVSVAMITGVMVSFSSFIRYYCEVSEYSQGTSVAVIYDATPEQVKTLKENEKIGKVGLLAKLKPEDFSFSMNPGDEKAAIYYIQCGDDGYFEQMITCTVDGRLPENENEIVVEKKFLEVQSLDWKIGDTVTLTLGDVQEGEFYGKFTPVKTAKYRITGLLNDNLPTSDCPILRNISAAEAQGKVNVNLELKEYDRRSEKTLYEIMDSIGAKEYTFSRDILLGHGIFTASNTVMNLLPFVAVMIVIIMTASVTMIYNAFSMSLSERTRYLGMLASVGATKKQKHRSVLFEGFVLGIIGIPLGIGFGVLGIFITLKAVGQSIVSTGMLGSDVGHISFNTDVPLWAVICIIVFSAMTILISCLIPAHKASRITPVDAIRQTNVVKLKARKLRSSKLIRKIFGYEGELANKNIKRNGRKGRVITFSIALSVVLFLTVNYFCTGMMQVVSDESNAYEVTAFAATESDYKKLKEYVADMQSVDDYAGICSRSQGFDSFSDFKTFCPGLGDESLYTPAGKALMEKKCRYTVSFIDDENFAELCEKNGLNSKDYFGTNACVIMNNVDHVSGNTLFNDKAIGRKIIAKDEMSKDGELTLKGFIKYDPDELICRITSGSGIYVYAPMSTWFDMQLGHTACVIISTDKHEEVTDELRTLPDLNRFSMPLTVEDNAENMKTTKQVVFVMEVFIYGFIVLITLVTVFNIMNTISTGMDLRSREFAMIKSVGTTPGGIRKMILLESLFYGLKALVIALPLSVLLTFLMKQTVIDDEIPFFIDWKLYLASVAAVFA
ncbi:MAG: ABC transporter permease, partial [Clostridia bacterium]|nr:ABC transporter permease [Clostridia bacterium]